MDINLHANNWACKGTIIDDVGGKKLVTQEIIVAVIQNE